LTHPTDGYQVPEWWEKLAHSPYFEEQAKQRWFALRQTVFNQDSLYAEIDKLVQEISGAIDRNFQKWPGVFEDNETYADAIQELKTWIEKRLVWIDSNMEKLVTQVENRTFQVADYQLEYNYPNPFNSSTIIALTIPAQQHVTIDIYNVLGQKVTRLVDKVLLSGHHEFAWQAQDVPSGAYFYKMQAGDISLMREMLLIK
jgi:hypothetical protein